MWKRLVGAGALLAGLAVGAGAVDAGDPAPVPPLGLVTINVTVVGPEELNINSWLPELYVDGTNEFVVRCTEVNGGSLPLASGRQYDCPVFEPETFTLGFPTPPVPYTVDFECRDLSNPVEAFDDPNATFTIDGETVDFIVCDIVMATNMVFVDKVFPYQVGVEGEPPAVTPDPDGGAEHGDFLLELYGHLGDLLDSGNDTNGELCRDFSDVAAGKCLVFEVGIGDLRIGETSIAGYLPVDYGCEPVGSPQFRDSLGEAEQLPGDNALFNISGTIPGESVYCSITNEYFEGRITLTKTITNDDGRTAVLGDFTLELYDGEGNLVDSGVCGNDGVCLDGDYPIGEYVVGEVGPDGYTRTVTQEILLPTDQLTEDEASFSLEPFARVTVNVASDDDPIPPTTTTTTTTTTVPVPTTLGPTTSDLGAGVATLPATGSDDDTGVLVALAAVLFLLGGAATALARRRS